jgi:ATP synthase protein I
MTHLFQQIFHRFSLGQAVARQPQAMAAGSEQLSQSTAADPPPVGGKKPGKGEYERLHDWLLLTTFVVSLIIAPCVALVYSLSTAANYLLGAGVGIIYLRMLGRGVAELGKTRNRMGTARFAVLAGVIIFATQINSLQVLPIFLGFLTYKITLLIYMAQTLTRLTPSRSR